MTMPHFQQMTRTTTLADLLRDSAAAFACVPQGLSWLAFAEWADNEHASTPSTANTVLRQAPVADLDEGDSRNEGQI